MSDEKERGQGAGKLNEPPRVQSALTCSHAVVCEFAASGCGIDSQCPCDHYSDTRPPDSERVAELEDALESLYNHCKNDMCIHGIVCKAEKVLEKATNTTRRR